MENFKFVSYIPTPTDLYMLGVAKVKVALMNPGTKQPLGELELRYKHVKTKDGTGSFFTPANYSTTDSMGEKKYIPCFLFDSRSLDEEMQDFLRDKVGQAMAQRSVHQTGNSGHMVSNSATVPLVGYPAQSTTMIQSTFGEVAANENLPF